MMKSRSEEVLVYTNSAVSFLEDIVVHNSKCSFTIKDHNVEEFESLYCDITKEERKINR